MTNVTKTLIFWLQPLSISLEVGSFLYLSYVSVFETKLFERTYPTDLKVPNSVANGSFVSQWKRQGIVINFLYLMVPPDLNFVHNHYLFYYLYFMEPKRYISCPFTLRTMDVTVSSLYCRYKKDGHNWKCRGTLFLHQESILTNFFLRKTKIFSIFGC